MKNLKQNINIEIESLQLRDMIDSSLIVESAVTKDHDNNVPVVIVPSNILVSLYESSKKVSFGDLKARLNQQINNLNNRNELLGWLKDTLQAESEVKLLSDVIEKLSKETEE